MTNASGYDMYQKNKVMTASPAELTLMLYEGAIKLWNNLIQYKIDPELRKISGNIMLEYGNEIGIFKNKKQKNN